MRSILCGAIIALCAASNAFAQAGIAGLLTASSQSDAKVLETAVRAGLQSDDARVRAVAARIANIRHLKSLVDTIGVLADRDPDANAAREELRAMIMLGGLRQVDRAFYISDRFSKRLDGDVATAAARLGADEIFVATGRRGNIEGLGLEAAGVRTERSYIVADRYLQTSVPRIWTCGDVHGGMKFTHVAAHEAVKLVRNILFPGRSAVDYTNIPWALFTDPEVGHIGLTEAQAVERLGRKRVRTYRIEMAEVDRAVVDRTPSGFVKFVCDSKGRILGAHVMAAGASTLIEEIVLAREKGVRIGALARLVSPYPSLADAIQKAAALHYQEIGASWIGSLAKRIASLAQ